MAGAYNVEVFQQGHCEVCGIGSVQRVALLELDIDAGLQLCPEHWALLYDAVFKKLSDNPG